MDEIELTEQIFRVFSDSVFRNNRINALYKKVRDGTATYEDAHTFSVVVGSKLASAFKKFDITMNGTVTIEQAMEIIGSPLRFGGDLIKEYAEMAQIELNIRSGLGIAAASPDVRESSIKAMARNLAENPASAEFDLGEQIIRFSQNVVDDHVSANAKIHNDLGLKPTIERLYEGAHKTHTGRGTDRHKHPETEDCVWCMNLAGKYRYEDVKRPGSEVYKRHDGCRCSVIYTPAGGTGSRMRTSGSAFVDAERNPALQMRAEELSRKTANAERRKAYVEKAVASGGSAKDAAIYFNKNLMDK